MYASMLASCTGVHPMHAGLFPAYAGMHALHAGMLASYAGVHAMHADMLASYAGVHAMHAGMLASYADVQPSRYESACYNFNRVTKLQTGRCIELCKRLTLSVKPKSSYSVMDFLASRSRIFILMHIQAS